MPTTAINSGFYGIWNSKNKINRELRLRPQYKSNGSDCLGIGNCTQGFKNHVKGCPPKAVDILAYLDKK